MKYSIAKSQIKSSKPNVRRSYDSRGSFYSLHSIETGCTKINQLIQCMYELTFKRNSRIDFIYDAPTDIFYVLVRHNNNIQYKLKFHLIVDDDKLGYNIKVDNINWTKVVKDAKLFNPCIAAQGDTLTVADTNHAELKLIVNAVKRHYAKYNLCEHYENMVTPAFATIEQEIDDVTLIDMINKHAKDSMLKRVKAFCKKYSITAEPAIISDIYFSRCGAKFLKVLKSSDGNVIANVEMRPAFKMNNYYRECPRFYMTYYINNKTGKITWHFNDDKFNGNSWYVSRLHCSDDNVKMSINIEQIGDWEFSLHAKSYDDWFAKFGFAEYVTDEVRKLMTNIKAKRGI